LIPSSLAWTKTKQLATVMNAHWKKSSIFFREVPSILLASSKLLNLAANTVKISALGRKFFMVSICQVY
jgi:hypothetical protein